MQKTLLSCILPLLFLALATMPSAAQEGAGGFESPNFPVPFGPNNVGTNFFLSFPSNWEYAAGEKYVRLYISAGVETEVRITANNGTFNKTVKTIPNDIVTVDLANNIAQPFVRNDRAPVPNDQVYLNRAVRIESDDPIIVYGINRTSFTSDGLLALPVNALGRQYIVASARSVAGGVQELPSQYLIIAPYDKTTVTVINSDDTPNNAEGDRLTIELNEGDVYSANSMGFYGDLSGTQIYANKPVGVMGGQNCTYLPNENFPACDHIVEMLTPIESWGTFYHSLPIQERTKGDTYRIFAGAPNAKIFINGSLYATLPGVGGGEAFGWIEYRQEERVAMEFSSDKPIFVAQYNNSQTYDNATTTDPFFMILTPVEQYQTDLIFTTPDNDFPKNYVMVISDSLGIENIEISQAGTNVWEKIRRYSGATAYRQFPTQYLGRKWAGLQIPIAPGVYRLRNTEGQLFAGYIYGQGNFDSYGYPLSVAVGNLQSKDTVAPLIDFEVDCKGTITEGTTTDLPPDDKVRTNLSTVRLHPNSVNYNLVVTKFDPGISVATTFRGNVVDLTKDATGIIISFDMAGNVSYDTVRYFARNLVIDPSPFDFGEVFVNQTGTGQVTLENRGNRAIDVVRLRLKTNDGKFRITNPTGAFTLPAGGSRTVDVEFSFATKGRYADSIGVEDTCGVTWISEIRARAVKPEIDVTDWNFALVPVGTLRQWEMTILNKGTGTLTVSGASGPDEPVFTLPNGLPAFPLTLAEGASRKLMVYFQPTASQQYIDTIFFAHNAPPDPAENDSIGIIRGEGIQATLYATPYDWPRKRVGTGPYTATVEIVNDGSADARIFGVKTITGDDTDFAVVDEQLIRNINVPANGGRVIVGVQFTPTAVGDRSARVIYGLTDPTDSTLFSDLTGIGVVPGLETEDLDFGTLMIGDPENQMTVDFRLAGDPQWRDTVWIERFDFVSDNAGGVDDFRYELPGGTTFPIVLIPGESNSITITGYFTPQANGQRNASVLAVTRDGVDTISRWTGVGTSENSGIQLIGGVFRPLCLGELDTIDVEIQSTGAAPLQITDIRLVDPSGDFAILASPVTPFTLTSGMTQTIQIVFTPMNGNGPRTATLEVDSDDPDDPTVTLDIAATAESYVITGQVELEGTTDDEDDGITEGVLGENITANVTVNEPVGPVGATGYQIILTYDADNLLAPTNAAAITLDPAVHPAGASVSFNSATRPGRLVLDVTSPTPLNGATAGKLLSMDFGVVFNANLERSVDVESVNFTGADVCATIAVTGDEIAISPICGLNLRLIDLIDGAKYALAAPTPNPVTGDLAEFEYGIAIAAPTTLELFDAGGNRVATIVDDYQQPGTYRVAIDVRTLPSGTYLCRLTSNQYEEVRQVVITK